MRKGPVREASAAGGREEERLRAEGEDRSIDEVGVRTKLAVFLKRKFSFLIELVFVEDQVRMLGRSSLFGLYNLLHTVR